MRSTMLSLPRSAPKRYKDEDNEDDEDFDEVILSEFKFGGKFNLSMFRRMASKRTMSAKCARDRSMGTAA